MPREANRAAEVSTTTGIGTFTLGGAILGFESFGQAFGTGGNTDITYTIQSDSGEWEVGRGTYRGVTNALQRDLVLRSSVGGSKVNFGPGTKKVYVCRSAEGPGTFRAHLPTDTPVEIRAAAGQTANLIQAFGAGGGSIFELKADGAVVVTNHVQLPSLGTVQFGDQKTRLQPNADGQIQAFVGNTLAARVDAPGTTASAATTIMTREKADARYSQSGGTGGSFPDGLMIGGGLTVSSGGIAVAGGIAMSNGALQLPSTAAIQFGSSANMITPASAGGPIQLVINGEVAGRVDQAGPNALATTTIMTREKADARYLRPGATSPSFTGGMTVAGGISIPNGGIAIAAGGLTVSGGVTVASGSVRIGETAGVQFGSASDMLSRSSNGFFQITVAGATAARVDPVGATIPNAATVITREKCDARYAAASSLRYKENPTPAGRIDGFANLVPKTWVWGGSLAEDDPRRGASGYGLIAEDLAALSAELVETDDEGRPDRLNLAAICAALLAEVKDQGRRIVALEQPVAA